MPSKELNTVYRQQVYYAVASLELSDGDSYEIYQFMIKNWLNPGDAESVAGQMNLI